jgi:hypothetical protein
MKTEHKIILYRTSVNAIQELKDTANALREELMKKEGRYSNTVRGMVRGIHLTIQNLAVGMGHNEDEMHGAVIWSYLLLVREFEPEHIDEAIDTALVNHKRFYKEAQEETPTEEELCTS